MSNRYTVTVEVEFVAKNKAEAERFIQATLEDNSTRLLTILEVKAQTRNEYYTS